MKISGPQKLVDALQAVEAEESQPRARPQREEKKQDEKPGKPKSSAYQYSLFLLSGQDYSEHKLRQKLKLKGYEATEIDETLTKLIEKNFLREEEYKKLLVKKLMRKGKADGMIKRQVQQEKLEINLEEMSELRAEIGVSKEDSILQLVNKKTHGKPWPTDRDLRQKLQQKIYRYLLSRGYSYDDAKRAVKASETGIDSST